MKRSRSSDTRDIVSAALREEQRERHDKLLLSAGQDGFPTGLEGDPEVFLSDSDVEDLSNVAKVGGSHGVDGDMEENDFEQARRARAVRETERDMQEAEEAFEDDIERQKKLKEDHGIELEAFNMREERDAGEIDGEGNFVGASGSGKQARRGPVDGKRMGARYSGSASDEDDNSQQDDAWLDGNEDKLVVDDATRERIEAQRKLVDEASERSFGPAELARWQYRIYKVLDGEETVAAALKRLGGGGGALANRKFVSAAAKKRMEREMAKRGGHGQRGQSDEDKKAFEEVTECATLLMNAGDTDVYGRDRAYFKRAAGLYIDIDESGDEGGEGVGDEDDDMFA